MSEENEVVEPVVESTPVEVVEPTPVVEPVQEPEQTV